MKQSFSLPERYIPLQEIEEFVKEAFASKFGADKILRVDANKYPDEYGTLVMVSEELDSKAVWDLTQELEQGFEDQGIEIGIGVITDGR